MFYSENNVFLRNRPIKNFFLSINILYCFLFSSLAWSAVSNITISDVTPRAFSVVWVSDVPVDTATVRVYSDIDGLDEITLSFSISVISSTKSLALGIVKVDVIGTENDTTYYFDIVTNSSSGLEISPPVSDPLFEVKTAFETTKSDINDIPIINGLIRDSIYEPNGIDVPTAGLLLVNVPSISQYPITKFIEESTETIPLSIAEAIVDLNNMYDKSTGSSARIIAGETMEIKKFRGLLCNFADQTLEQTRKVPVDVEIPPITELHPPGACFSPADFNCDDRVSLEDLGTLAARFGLERPDCRFNPDLDFNDDGRIGLFDLGVLAPLFGTSK